MLQVVPKEEVWMSQQRCAGGNKQQEQPVVLSWVGGLHSM